MRISKQISSESGAPVARPPAWLAARLAGWPAGWLAALLLYVLCRGLLMAAIVPPWQGPDEPSHFEYVVLTARQRGPPVSTDPALQAQILASMQAARWYAWLGEAAPPAPPGRFDDLPRLADAPTQVGSETPLGYLPYLPAAWLALPRGLEAALAAMRLSSVGLSLLLVVAVLGAARLALDAPAGEAHRLTLAAGLTVAALPILAFDGAMLGNDLPAALIASLWLGLAGRSLRRGPGRASALALLGLALLAAPVKRSLLFLTPLALVLLAVSGRGGAPASDATAAADATGSIGSIGPDSRRRRPFARPPAAPALLALLALALLAAWPRPELAAGWTRVGRAWGPERRVDAARSGRAGLRITDTDPLAWQYLEQWTEVQAGETLLASAWLRGASGGQAQLVLNDDRGHWWSQTLQLDRDWQRAALTLTLPAGSQRLRLALVPGAGDAAGMAQVDADDVHLRRWEAAPATGARRPGVGIANGGAEAPRRLGPDLWRFGLRYTAAQRLIRAMPGALTDPAGSLAAAARGLGFTFASFWGGFGWLRIWPGAGYDGAARLLTLWALLAWALALTRPRWLAAGAPETARLLRGAAVAAGLALACALVGSMAGTAGERLPQGRYLLPALLPLALPALALAERLAPRRGPLLLARTVLVLDLWALLGLIWPAYRGPV